MTYLVATILLGPVLLAQGLWARRRTPRLPEPDGPRAGRTGRGTRLRVLVVGDSAAAGVGAATQDEALSGRLVARLAPSRDVSWRLLAKNGATTASTLERLAELPPTRFDAVLTSLGVNDLVRAIGMRRWRREQRQLREVLRAKFGVGRLIVSGLPPVWGFPALPQPLRWYLGRRAKELDRALARDVEAETDVAFLPLDFALDATAMAEDGFHPGPAVYAAWAERAAERMTESAGASTRPP